MLRLSCGKTKPQICSNDVLNMSRPQCSQFRHRNCSDFYTKRITVVALVALCIFFYLMYQWCIIFGRKGSRNNNEVRDVLMAKLVVLSKIFLTFFFGKRFRKILNSYGPCMCDCMWVINSETLETRFNNESVKRSALTCLNVHGNIFYMDIKHIL